MDFDDHDSRYEQMLEWPLTELMGELHVRVTKLERIVHALEKAERQHSPRALLIGIVVVGFLALAALVLAVIPFADIGPRYWGTFEQLPEVIAILVAPALLYGLYLVYSTYRAVMQRRYFIERFIAGAQRLIDEARDVAKAEARGESQSVAP